jgi:hypothetical protein
VRVPLFTFSNSDQGEYELISECRDFTLRVETRSIGNPGRATVSRDGHFVLRKVKKYDASSFDLWPCYASGEDEETEYQPFNVQACTSFASSSWFSERTLELRGHRIFASWDGIEWFEILSLKK